MVKSNLLSEASSPTAHRTKSKPKPVWRAAKDLQPGDKVILADGTRATVTKVKPAPGLHTVHNFAVEGDHTYFVSEMGVLVHNQYGASDGNSAKRVSPTEDVTVLQLSSMTSRELYAFTEELALAKHEASRLENDAIISTFEENILAQATGLRTSFYSDEGYVAAKEQLDTFERHLEDKARSEARRFIYGDSVSDSQWKALDKLGAKTVASHPPPLGNDSILAFHTDPDTGVMSGYKAQTQEMSKNTNEVIGTVGGGIGQIIGIITLGGSVRGLAGLAQGSTRGSQVTSSAKRRVIARAEDKAFRFTRANSLSAAEFKKVLQSFESANPVVDSLRKTGELPSNYFKKADARILGWSKGKAFGNHAKNGQIGGDVFENGDNLLPSAKGRIWKEADIGINPMMKRSKQAGTRLVYSNDGMMFTSTNHYESFNYLGRYK